MTPALRQLRERFDPIPGQERSHPLRNGTIVLAFVALLTLVVLGLREIVPLPLPKGGEVVEAEFDRALYMGQDKAPTPVRVNGVNVGEVESVELLPDGTGVRAKMRLDDGIAVKQDSRATAYTRTVLGFNFYVELDPGSPSAKPLGEQAIPRSQTETQIELDEVLTAFDGPARGAMQKFIAEFDEGFSDPGAASEALRQLGPGMRDVAPAASAFRGLRPGQDLPELVSSASRLMGSLAAREQQLAGMIDSAEVAFGVTAARRADIGATQRQAPATMCELRRTGARLRTTLDQLDPVAEQLRPGARRLDDAARALTPALDAAEPLLSDARPLFRALPPALRDLGQAAQTGAPLLRGLDPTLDRLRDDLIPWFDGTDDELGIKVHQMLGPAVSAVQAATAYFDSYGHIITLPPGLTPTRSLRTFPCDVHVFDAGELVECRAIRDTLGALISGNPPPDAGAKGDR